MVAALVFHSGPLYFPSGPRRWPGTISVGWKAAGASLVAPAFCRNTTGVRYLTAIRAAS